ncbi:MAG: NADH-quinone oxidoreductase subunit C [Actinomycetota bacterium]|nr:NADH-quinone oxidoreductase subunit C [Actinomycetota bacterium]
MSDESPEPENFDAATSPEGVGNDGEEAYGVPVSWSRGQRVLHPSREQYLEVVEQLRDDGYRMCVDVCGVDYLTHEGRPRHLPAGVTPERFEVVANLLNHRERARVRVRVQVPADDPTCPSLWPVHAGVENPERETFDMLGITFDGHPDMTRILMPETWEGHPLRKDYPVGRIPVQFKGAHN